MLAPLIDLSVNIVYDSLCLSTTYKNKSGVSQPDLNDIKYCTNDQADREKLNTSPLNTSTITP
jgi:hypothetical protein